MRRDELQERYLTIPFPLRYFDFAAVDWLDRPREREWVDHGIISEPICAYRVYCECSIPDPWEDTPLPLELKRMRYVVLTPRNYRWDGVIDTLNIGQCKECGRIHYIKYRQTSHS